MHRHRVGWYGRRERRGPVLAPAPRGANHNLPYYLGERSMNSLAKAQRMALRVFIPTLLCVVLGYAIFGTDVFAVQHHAFQLVANGFIGAVFLTMLCCAELRSAFGTFIVLAFLNTAFLSDGVTGATVLRDFMLALTLCLASFVFYYVCVSSKPNIHLFDILGFGGLFAAMNFFASMLIRGVYGSRAAPVPAEIDALVGLLTGIGLGFGLRVSNLVIPPDSKSPA